MAPVRKANVPGQKSPTPGVARVVTRTRAILAGQARAHPVHQRAVMQCGDRAGLPTAGVTGAGAGTVKEGIAVRG